MDTRHPHGADARPTDGSLLAPPRRSAWRFTVDCPHADQVLLVREDEHGLSNWLGMTSNGNGRWGLTLPMDHFDGRFRYYTIEGGAVLNCGTAGLSASRLPLSEASGEEDAPATVAAASA